MTLFFDKMAPVYDLMIDDKKKREKEEMFFQSLAWGTKAEEGGIVDLGCGTGFYSRLLAEKGYKVLAVDLSPGMVNYAKVVRVHENITYKKGDMRVKQAENKALVICMGNTISLFSPDSDLKEVFSAVSSTLRDGGLFLFQHFNYRKLLQDKLRIIYKEGEIEHNPAIIINALIHQEKEILLNFTVFQKEKKTWTSFNTTSVLYPHSKSLFIDIAAQFKMTLEKEYGDFLFNPFDEETSTDHLYVFQKREIFFPFP